MASALTAMMSFPAIELAAGPSPLHELTRLRAALGPGCPRLFVKRDDLLTFAMGGNKVRKMQTVAAEAAAAGADTLVTCGGVQSNHARVTAAVGAALGWKVVLVLNGTARAAADETGNARLDRLFGADIHIVGSREARNPAMEDAAATLREAGRTPFVVPLGASTPVGAIGMARGVAELATSGLRPGLIVHATSSAGTQAGLIAGCALLGLKTRVLGISADDPPDVLQPAIARLLDGVADRLGARPATVGADREIDVDARWVGPGYGIPTPASTEAASLVAQREGIVLDPVYTAKAMAGLIHLVRAGAFGQDDTILFWHTGGTPGYFAG
jgi:1-aminocyclopropane-1-carboxylate deaminase/D-cysteine desulfhydrase-like pyridoxal-dependent ACC family enzyme